MTPDAEDPFIGTTAAVESLNLPEAMPRRRRLSFGKIAAGRSASSFPLRSGFGSTGSCAISFRAPTGLAMELSQSWRSASSLS